MAKGDGSITQRGRGSWRVRISAGFEPTTGKRRYVTATAAAPRRTPAGSATGCVPRWRAA